MVVMLAWPRVAWTRWIGAPRSRAWLAWAWRSQCGETARSMPARLAAWRTMRSTATVCRAAPCLRDRKTAVRHRRHRRGRVSRSLATDSGNWIARVFAPLPKTVIWTPSPLGCTSRQQRPHSSLTRTPEA